MRKMLALVVPAIALSLASPLAAQDTYPTRTIEMIVPFGPGGSTDTSARLFASVLGKYLPNNPDVVVVNKPGGATTIGMSAVKNSDSDGYTIGLTSNSPITIQPHFKTADYSWDSFEPVIKLVNIPQVLLVKADAPWNTIEEWLDYVRRNPGAFTYATPGNGSISDLSMAVLNEMANIETRAIPYNSGGKAMAAMLGGNVGGVATFQGNADKTLTKVLVNFSSERSAKHPDVPTLKDAGIDANKNAYIGIVTPKGVDPEIIKTLHDAFKKSLEDPAVVSSLAKQAFDISYANSEDFRKIIKADYDVNGDLLRRANLVE